MKSRYDYLSEQERAILSDRLLRKTLKEIGKDQSPPVTKERVRQVEAMALRKIYNSFSKGGSKW